MNLHRIFHRKIQLFIIRSAFFLIIFGNANAQSVDTKQLESQLKSTYGLDKLKVLNQLTEVYLDGQHRKALKYAKQAVPLGKKVFNGFSATIQQEEKKHLLQAYYQLGEAHFKNENFLKARDYLEQAQSLSQELSDSTYLKKNNLYLAQIQTLIDNGEVKDGIFSNTMKNLNIGEKVKGTANDLKIQTELQLARSDEKKKKFTQAIGHYEKAINLLRNKGKPHRISELQLKISVLLDSLGHYEKAQELLTTSIAEMEGQGVLADAETIIDERSQEMTKSIEQSKAQLQSMKKEQKNFKALSEQYAEQKDYKKSLEYYVKYQALSKKIIEDSVLIANEQFLRDQELVLLRQQKEIADLNVNNLRKEKKQQERIRNYIIFITVIILLSALIALYFYLNKRKEHQKLTRAYQDLDETKVKLEGAEKKITNLLKQQLSGDVAQALLSNETSSPGGKHFVCVMFLDIRGFTPIVEKLSPEEIIAYQNKVFGFMIDIVLKHHGTINQLMGDGFMATFGAPLSHGNDCNNAYLAARDILDELQVKNDSNTIPETRVGIGLHAGNVVTGNVGNDARKQYSVTGNPVIIAARVEQLNKTYHSQLIITEEVHSRIEDVDALKPDFKEVQVKGRSEPVRILTVV